MKKLNKKEEVKVVKLMAKEFLEDKLGVNASEENIRRFTAHILLFEKQLKCNKIKKEKD